MCIILIDPIKKRLLEENSIAETERDIRYMEADLEFHRKIVLNYESSLKIQQLALQIYRDNLIAENSKNLQDTSSI